MRSESINSLFSLFGMAVNRFIHNIFISGIGVLIYFAILYIGHSYIVGGEERYLPRFALWVTEITLGIAIHNVFAACITSSKGDIKQDINNLLNIITSRGPVLLGTAALQFLAIFIGTLLFIIPGVYISITTLLAPQIVIYENKGFMDAFKRSAEIMDGAKLSTFFVFIIITISIIVVIYVPLFILGFTSMEENDQSLSGFNSLPQMVFSACFAIIWGIFYNLIYLKRRNLE